MSEINKRISRTDILESKTDGKKTWNVQTLRTEIRQLTKEANLVLLQNEDRKDYQQLAARLQEVSKSKAKKSTLFVGNLNYKTIGELEIQLRGLQQFLEYDTLSEQAQTKRNERFEQARKKYNKTTGERLSAKNYEKVLQTFTSISSIVDEYGSESLRELDKVARRQHKKIDILSEIRKAENQVEQKGKIKTPENVLDQVYSNIGIRRK